MIVKKFGGTSVGSLERIENVCKFIAKDYNKKTKLAVVVSAMAGETDRLLNLYKNLNQNINTIEYDLLLSSGEQASCALVSSKLQSMGYKSIPLLGHQAGFVTNDQRGRAKIVDMQVSKISELLNDGYIPIVAGFQGADQDGFITTLGRGGSDTSAVALAVAIKANICEIYTDVVGVFSCDPRLVPNSKMIQNVSFEEMLELASLGAKVLHPRSVELAAKYKMPIKVLSSFEEGEGTVISNESNFESPVVSALTYDHNMSLVSVLEMDYKVNFLDEIFTPLSKHGVVVDIIVHSNPNQSHVNLSFSVPREDVQIVQKVLSSHNYKFEVHSGLSKISAIGSGMRTHFGVAARIFNILSQQKIPISATTTSEISVTCVIPSAQVPDALKALHSEFGLDLN